MKPRLFIAAMLLVVSVNTYANSLDDFNRHFPLIPQPQKVELMTVKGLWYSDLRSLLLVNTNEKPVMPAILEELPLANTAGPGTISLIIDKNVRLPSVEGYILEIKNKQVNIKANEKAGLFYGLQTLKQLLEDSHDQQIEIPSSRITDYPEIPYRAIHLDIKHHIDAGNYYYNLIDRLAAVKINAIIVEFEDKLRYRKAPQVGSGNALSIDEFATLSKYAEERFIEISPLVQGLGHASFILKHEEYKQLRDDTASDWAFDPLNPQTYDLQFSLYEDAIAATPYGKYLHVGGDEVGTLGKSDLAKKSGMKPIELQMYWLKKVSDFAVQHGRIPIFWDDMVFKLSNLYETTYDKDLPAEKVNALWNENEHLLNENRHLFPGDCMYMRWNYDYSKIPGNEKAIDWYKANGLNVMAATAAQQIWPMIPRNHSNGQAIKDFCELTSTKKMSGILCTIWDDASPHFETVWRGIYDFGFFSWNFENISIDKVHEKFRHRFYSPALAGIDNEFEDLLEDALPFWENGLLKEGDRLNYHKDAKLIDLPDKNNPGLWSNNNKKRLENAAKALKQYAIIREKISKASALTRRNRYSLEVMNQVNELQVYSAKLLLLLEKVDKASAQNKQEAVTSLRNHVESFKSIRDQFEKVYGKTRIMGNPPGYKLDMNIHGHLANGTINTDWMFMYELPINQKVSEWIAPKGM
jgi:hypothetical protein